ncbi:MULTISPECIES: nicotinate-nucleotide adenylyltransferase [unclassified Clostridium]|uniref:nicotinate-nucleotide adenylyltransferase n=1 Tax=unclassified Clostridium TaxID=2614128 RepID=UPI00029846E5|nr:MULTISPECIES: nicotinate-nucleotide adenylyltransferase [unclassified Clostridium]EKQ55117.1 MAG: nicotinate/nicotinamide nucleotide adenylyltransferase [Clostridium sp. Maddingley MBC34-26]
MKRYGIIGGTFDPIHYAHLYIAYEAKEQLDLDEVVFMPAGTQPLKADSMITDPKLRYDMVKAAIEPFSEFSISDYEIEKGGLSFTYETLEYFKENIHDEEKELFFITGADCLFNMEKWREVQRIFSLATLVVFSRGGISKTEMLERKQIIEKKYNGKIIILDLKRLEISSTEIRELVKHNKRIDFFVPQKVVDIIYEKGLYSDKDED